MSLSRIIEHSNLEFRFVSDSYFLLGDEVRFYFDPAYSSLHYQQNIVRLPVKEAQTLKFAVDHHDQLFTPTQLAIMLWGKSVVDLNQDKKKSQAITQISKLRKRFKQLGYRNPWLITHENQGYQLTCTVDIIFIKKKERTLLYDMVQRLNRDEISHLLSFSSTVLVSVSLLALLVILVCYFVI